MIPSGAEHRQHKGSDTGNQRGVRTKHQVKDREQEGAEQIAFLLCGGQRKSLNTLSGKGRALTSCTSGDFFIRCGMTLTEEKSQLSAGNQSDRRFEPFACAQGGGRKTACAGKNTQLGVGRNLGSMSGKHISFARV